MMLSFFAFFPVQGRSQQIARLWLSRLPNRKHLGHLGDDSKQRDSSDDESVIGTSGVPHVAMSTKTKELCKLWLKAAGVTPQSGAKQPEKKKTVSISDDSGNDLFSTLTQNVTDPVLFRLELWQFGVRQSSSGSREENH